MANWILAMLPMPHPKPYSPPTSTLTVIGLPDTLPLPELTNTTLHLNLTSPDLNEVHLEPMHITTHGMDLSTQAVVVGLREFLTSSNSPLGTQLSKLFVQLHTQVGVDLELIPNGLTTFWSIRTREGLGSGFICTNENRGI